MPSTLRYYKLKLNTLFILWVLFYSIIFVPPSFALDPTKSIKQYGLDVWDANKGFPYFAIHSMIQTQDGYIWLATDEGAVRFDGVQFTLFDSSNTKGIKNNNISSFAEDGEGNLWIGTRGGGICKYKDGVFTTKSMADGLPGLNIHAMCLDHDGAIWMGVESFGLSKLQNEKFANLSVKNQPNVGQFYVIYEFRNGELGFGVGGYQIKEANSDRMKFLPQRKGYVKGIVEDFLGRRWIGTDLGLFFQEHDTLVPVNLPGAPTTKPITVLFEDSDHNIWIGTEGNGLFRYSGGEFSSITMEDGLASNRILSIIEDAEKNLWVGTRGGGLTRLKDQSIVTFSKKDGLSGDYITALYECKDGTIFIASKESQLDEIKNGLVVSSYRFDTVIPSNHVRGIFEDNDGTIWVGTQHGTFLLKKTKTGTRRKITDAIIPEFLHREEVRVFFRKSDGTFYLGSYGRGLWKLENGKYSLIKIDEKITRKGSYHRGIVEDSFGNLWLATQQGILTIQKDTILNYSIFNGLTNNQVFGLYNDTDGSIWIGTYGGGMCRIKNNSIKQFFKKDGLFDDVIYSIVEDDKGCLWMSCNKGIFYVSKQQLNDFAEGKISSFKSTSYGVADGMKSFECNGGSQYSAMKLHDGTLMFATVNGVVKVDPNNIQSNTLPPPVIIEEINIDGQPHKAISFISTLSGAKEFEIQYTALSFVVPEKVYFRYTLEGFDNHWNEVGARRKAYYTNLPPGKYVFKVIACNNAGVWNYQGASLTIIISPLFWETWWFRLTTGIIGIIFILLIFKKRERIITEREQQKLAMQKQLTDLESRALRAQMNPHFIFNALNSIQECILTNKTEAACEYLSKFAQLLRITLESSEKTFIPLEKEIQVLQLYLELESLRFDNEFDYVLNIDPELDNMTFQIPAMMIQPYVENSIWHGLLHKHNDRKLTISLHPEHEMLLCIVEDNGIGRQRASEIKHAMKKDYESKGMRVTRERLEIMKKGSGVNASVHVIDLFDTLQHPIGTRVEILIPILPL